MQRAAPAGASSAVQCCVGEAGGMAKYEDVDDGDAAALRSRSYFKWRYAPAGLGNDFACIIRHDIHTYIFGILKFALFCGVKLAAAA